MSKKIVLLSILLSTYCFAFSQAPKPNVIFIMVDDLNDYVEGFEGHPQVETPNINRIANKGVSFLSAYCSSPGCAPSRTSMLSGKDIHYTQVYNNDNYDGNFRINFSPLTSNGQVFTLPEILKDSGGYYTYAINKVFHSSSENDYDASEIDDCNRNQSWNKLLLVEESEEFKQSLTSYGYNPAFGFGMIPDELEPQLEDYRATTEAVNFIHSFAVGEEVTCEGKPFFLALGYHRPHNGRYIPEKYFPEYYIDDNFAMPYENVYNQPVDRFPYNGIIMPPQPEEKFADYYTLPANGLGKYFSDATTMEGNFAVYVDGLSVDTEIDQDLSSIEVNEIITETQRANYVMAYIASVQYIDAQIGRVMDELEKSPALLENTVIVLVSDHGYSLGEKRHYTKWALWETVLRIPLIISTPEIINPQVCKKTVSLLDIFPTICDLTATAYPTMHNGDKYLDGESMLPLLEDPDANWNKPAISSYQRNTNTGSCFPHYSVRTDKFHYIRYQSNNDGSLGRNVCDSSGSTYEEELYEIGINREIDPNEWNNLASSPEYENLIDYLQQFLPDGNLYLEIPYNAEITNGTVGCFLPVNGNLKLKGKLYKPDGSAVSASNIQYIYTWSNNLTVDVFTGKDYTFNLALMRPYKNTNDHITFYLHITEVSTGNVIAFTQKTFGINIDNTPDPVYTVVQDANEVTISNYSLKGSYTYVTWDMGDGYTTNAYLPGMHVYAEPGTYTITNTVYFGNGCSTVTTSTVTISSIEFQKIAKETTLRIYPNPASEIVQFISDTEQAIESVQILNLYGQLVKHYQSNEIVSNSLNISDLPVGSYMIKVVHNNDFKTAAFEIIR